MKKQKKNCQTCKNFVLIDPNNPNWSKCVKIEKLSREDFFEYLVMQSEGCPEYVQREEAK